MVFQARLMSADEALTAGFLHEIVPARQDREARPASIAQKVASHAPLTLWATKEAVRRIQAARQLPDGDDIVRKIYGSADFKEGVKAFVEKRSPRWSGKVIRGQGRNSFARTWRRISTLTPNYSDRPVGTQQHAAGMRASIASAARRLMTKSKVVDRSTGISPGFAPLTMR